MEKFSLMEKKSSLFNVGGNEIQFFFSMLNLPVVPLCLNL